MAKLNISDYTYSLPEEQIALYPLAQRDQSKLLYYNKGAIDHQVFHALPELLPAGSILFFNDTKVIPARLHFQKETGAQIELFLLNPVLPSTLLQLAMEAKGKCTWKCTIGNLKRWTDGTLLKKTIEGGELTAHLADREKQLVQFTWTAADVSFAEVIRKSGATPLPPYIKRAAEAGDLERYQTVYSHFEGAVAAPTAGLHFTNDVLARIRNRGIATDFLTLHVSAGTFQPVKVENALEHVMHNEQVIISRKNLANVLNNETVIAVGTTSMRTLESVYWFGVKLLKDSHAEFIIGQHDPYENNSSLLPATKESLTAVDEYMQRHGLEELTGHTSIFILPGYTFRVCKGLVTNFHQPGSTLMLLVAAFVGEDWKHIYSEALEKGYRFLSYGDSSLLIP